MKKTGARPARLSPEELARHLDRILEAAVDLVERLPADRMEYAGPQERPATSPAAAVASRPDHAIRDVGFDLFRLSVAFADGMDASRFPEAHAPEPAPAEMIDGADIARYGALVRGRLEGWFAAATPGEYARRIHVGNDRRSGHELLQRTVRQAEGRLRRLVALAAEIGISPTRPLPDQAFGEERQGQPAGLSSASRTREERP
jgi:hypothetical protein